MSPHRNGKEIAKFPPKNRPKKPKIPNFPKNISSQLFQKRNRNAVAVVAAVLETTCRTHLLWSLAPL